MTYITQVYRYLRGTSDYGITYGKPTVDHPVTPGFDSALTTYVDASLGGPHSKGRSTTGVLVCHYGSPIIWCSQLQSLVALSTMESEYMATSTGTQLTLFGRSIYGELNNRLSTATELFTDNLPNVMNIRNQSTSGRTRHIDLRFNFISDQVSKGTIAVIHIPGEINPADLLTKPLPAPRFHDFRNKMMRITTSGVKLLSSECLHKTVKIIRVNVYVYMYISVYESHIVYVCVNIYIYTLV